MKKNIWIYGTISGIICTGWMVFAMATNSCQDMMNTGSEILGFTIMIVAFSLIFVGVKNYRDKLNNGVITFGRAFKMGLYMTLIASTMYVIVWSIDYNFFAQDFMEKYASLMLEKVKEKGGSPAEIKEVADKMQMYKDLYKNPLSFVLITYTEILPVGLLLSLISALILRKKPAAGAQAA